MRTIVITGGTGLVGSALSTLLNEKGYKVIVLTRNASGKNSTDQLQYREWDVRKQTIDATAIREADVIVHLAGAGVADKRWSKAYKKEILESRTLSAALLVKSLKEIPNKVTTVVSASGIGWYGPDMPGKIPFTEDAPAENGFLGQTCIAWENSIAPVKELGKRLVILRTGLALSNQGGAYKEFAKPVKMGVAAILGNGKQVMSWIHIHDLCRLYLHAIEAAETNGVYNAVAPKPATNKEITLEIAKRVKPGFHIPLYVPSFMLKIVLGEMSIEVLKSTTVSAEKVRKTGFQFKYPSIEAAVAELTAHH